MIEISNQDVDNITFATMKMHIRFWHIQKD